ncbi:hypothetical protein SAMN04515674_103425 [Pseudarcicella hirudinis]|uniref:Lipocalin-like domain-containing protein n=1 Tax=Pseudarcicella hirudinis TaxID=1079859 RepID=A0A1I5QY31_9BACT|nr:hypothetical protein [Pseudarcicella hirudinis]SFP51178.1 hypothetical protein SAMN04515674_103425 [Pseudarcicella hirudinis]
MKNLILLTTALFAIFIVTGCDERIPTPGSATGNSGETNNAAIKAALAVNTWQYDEYSFKAGDSTRVVYRRSDPRYDDPTLKASYITFKTDGTLVGTLPTGTQNGTWKLIDNNGKLQVTIDGDIKNYQITKLNAQSFEYIEVFKKSDPGVTNWDLTLKALYLPANLTEYTGVSIMSPKK